ncbi:MAG TPA: universal stress protein [Anaerolineae bacterium]|nr:universal stress protein [Anaerolineae bacterium]
MFNKILVAYDGSPHSDRALDAALALAKYTQSELVLVHAHDKIPSYLGDPNFQQAVNRAVIAGRELLETAAKRARAAGVQVMTNVLEGPPAEAILRVAEAEHCDLIVMGSRGLGQLKGLLLGSVSERVLQHAAIPVMIVR